MLVGLQYVTVSSIKACTAKLKLCLTVSSILQVTAIGMDSPELLQLVEDCPQGGEVLIMRMLHILTENGVYVAPNIMPDFRDLYNITLLWNPS